MRTDERATELRTYERATAIVTGGASGIGEALALELARRGGEVVVADLQEDAAARVVDRVVAAGGTARAVAVDVSDFEQVRRLVDDTLARSGRLDYLFNNAGISHGMGAGAAHYRIEDWRRIVEVNLMGVIHGVQAAYPKLIGQGFGHVVNTASMAGLVPSPGMTSYVTTKHAIVGLSQNLRAEGAQHGVRVSVLCPGVIRTPFIEGGKYGRHVVDMSADQYREMWEKRKPMPVDQFARKALDAVARNRGIVVLPASWKLFWWIHRLSPSLSISLGTKGFQDVVTAAGHPGTAPDPIGPDPTVPDLTVPESTVPEPIGPDPTVPAVRGEVSRDA